MRSIPVEKIRVLIADDVQIIRQGLKAILNQDEAIEVVASAADGREAFEKCRVYRPDVVLMDMRMPEYDGAYGIEAIKRELGQTKVLVLTTFDDEETVSAAIEKGADGYLLKEMEDEQVIAAIRHVHAGLSVFGTKVFQNIRQQMTGEGRTPGSGSDADQTARTYCSMISREMISFTEKEHQLLKLVAEGYDNKEIAKTLFLAEGTTRNQISRLLEKVEAKDRTQLAVYAVKNGLDL